MKKNLIAIAAILLVIPGMMSCQKEEAPAIANFTIDYSFAESGSMTKASENAFDVIYNNYIVTRLITPTHYSLSFTLDGQSSPAVTLNGVWKNNEVLALPVGTYQVTGKSDGTSDKRADTLGLSFNQKVTIEAGTKKLSLKADYACCMLIFDAEKIESIKIDNSNYSNAVAVSEKCGDYYYCCFDITDLVWNQGDDWNSHRLPRRVIITRKDGTRSEIIIVSSNFENGKYYYYKDIEGEFELSKMEAGS